MTEVRFYHLQTQSLDEALPQILEKAYATGKPIQLVFHDEAEMERLNAHLWTWKAESFLPHGSAKTGALAQQPITLTLAPQENPNKAKILILTQGCACADVSGYDMCLEILDGRHDDQVKAARARWTQYKEQGHDVTYWSQSAQGRWEKKSA